MTSVKSKILFLPLIPIYEKKGEIFHFYIPSLWMLICFKWTRKMDAIKAAFPLSYDGLIFMPYSNNTLAWSFLSMKRTLLQIQIYCRTKYLVNIKCYFNPCCLVNTDGLLMKNLIKQCMWFKAILMISWPSSNEIFTK